MLRRTEHNLEIINPGPLKFQVESGPMVHLKGRQLGSESEFLTVAVIGAGSIGMRYLTLLRQIPGIHVIAVPVRSSRIQELEGQGFLTARNVVEAAHKGSTLCIVATDTHRHVEDAGMAMEAGLEVLVEKPLAIDGPQAKRLRVRSKESGRTLFVACVLRFSEALNGFHDFLGRIGRLHSVRIECQSYLPDWRPERNYRDSYSARSVEGGVLRDLIHEIDYAGWLFGWPIAIQARVRNVGRLSIEAEEAADLMWETNGGVVVSLSLDYLTRPPRRYMRAAGEHGTVEWDGIEGTTILALAGKAVEVVRSSQTRNDMFLAQARAFVGACRGNSDPRLSTCEDGIRALAICDAARRSSQSGREEGIDYL